MNRTRHTITLDPGVLAMVDARIDGHEVRNRSQAIEQLLVQQLAGGTAGLVLLSNGSPVRFPPFDLGYPLFTVGNLASNQLPPHTVLPGDFGAATALALGRPKLPERFLVVDLDLPLALPALRTILAAHDGLVTSVFKLEETVTSHLGIWAVDARALDLLPAGNQEMPALVSAVHAKGGHRGYLHVD